MPSYPLVQNDAHLWFLSNDNPEVERFCEEGLDFLSPDERHRHQMFSHPSRARQFLLGRFLVRRSLAAHLAVREGELRFVYGPTGKPELSPDIDANVAFNLSHTKSGIAVAVARAEKLGIDLELLSRASSVRRIARRFFSEAESRHLQTHNEGTVDQEAVGLWCLKESIVKATGSTVWDGLAAVSLGFDEKRVRWISPPPEGHESQWFLMCGLYRADCVFALAVKSADTPSEPQTVVFHNLDDAPKRDIGSAIGCASGPFTVCSVPV